jgi:hypothetical protein
MSANFRLRGKWMPVANTLAFYGKATNTSVKSFIGSSCVCRCKTSRLNPFGRILHLFIVKLHFFAVFTDDFLLTFDITYPSKRYLNGSYHDYYILKQIQYPSNILSYVDISMGPIGSSVYQSGKTEHI